MDDNPISAILRSSANHTILLSPEYDRQLSILRRRSQYFEAVTRWMRRIPLVGRIVYFWWYAYLDEGLDGAVDMLCFHFLDDVNPTARWHKWS
jgi:hypothetical protein